MTLKTTLDNSIYQEQKIIQNKQFAEIHTYKSIKKTMRAYWLKRRVETNGSFQNHSNSLEIVITWCYRKPFYILLSWVDDLYYLWLVAFCWLLLRVIIVGNIFWSHARLC